jgi:hypothetical protein
MNRQPGNDPVEIGADFNRSEVEDRLRALEERVGRLEGRERDLLEIIDDLLQLGLPPDTGHGFGGRLRRSHPGLERLRGEEPEAPAGFQARHAETARRLHEFMRDQPAITAGEVGGSGEPQL